MPSAGPRKTLVGGPDMKSRPAPAANSGSLFCDEEAGRNVSNTGGRAGNAGRMRSFDDPLAGDAAVPGVHPSRQRARP